MDAESDLDYEECYPGMKVRNSFRATVSQLLKKVGDECSLTYDMGDSWHHTVRLLEIRRYEDAQIRFSNIGVELLSGTGTCPPKDCGGISGYEEILRIIKDPEEYEYERFRSLLGPGCDPTFFDIRLSAAGYMTMSGPLGRCCTGSTNDNRGYLDNHR